VYILYSEKIDKYYVGCTEDLTVRLTQHNSGRNASTKAGAPWTLVYSESFESLKDARQREAAIKKKKSRKYIEWLLKGN
jgi:putative endonuclease